MSAFDKYVAQWVSRAGEDLPKETRQQLLRNINSSLGYYEALRDLSEAQGRKEHSKKKQSAEEKEEARKSQEEQDQQHQERRVSLPPLPPSKDGTDTPFGAAVSNADAGFKDNAQPKKKKMRAKKRSAAGTYNDDTLPNNGANLDSVPCARKSGHKPAKIPFSKTVRTPKPAARLQAGSVQLKNIDFSFGKLVDEQLREIETEQPSTKRPNAFKTKVKAPLSVKTTQPTASAEEGELVAPPPPTAAAEPHKAPGMMSTAVPNAANVGRKRSSPPPLDQVVAGDGELDGSRIGKSQETKVSSKSEEDSEGNSGPFFGAKRNYQDRLNAFHFASVGEDRNGEIEDRSDVEEDYPEEEFIDDHEDAHRRDVQMQRPSRPAISDSTLDIDEARIANFPTTPKSQNKVKTISRVLVRHFLFSTLDDSDIAKFASIMDLENFKAGEKLITKGEPNGTFYIILDGEAETREVNEAGEEVVVPLICGSTCGDVALMYEFRNEATVVARTAVQCATLERRTYKMITSRAMEEKRTKYIDFLTSISLFQGLTHYELERVAECLKEDTYVEGQKVITYGVPNHWLHIVMEGALRVMSLNADDGSEKEVAVVQRGHFVGEIEFIYHHLPVATVYAATPVVKTAKLSRRSFEMLPSEIRERLVRLVEDDETYTTYHNRMRSSSPPAFDLTPPFDAPRPSVQKSLRQYESEQSEGTPAANGDAAAEHP